MGERLEGEQHRGRVVVDDESVLGTREAPEERFYVAVPGAPLLGGEVELEVRIGGADGGDAFEREGAEERTAEIRVQDHALRVDDRPEREGADAMKAGGNTGRQRVHVLRLVGAFSHASPRGRQ